MWGERAFATLGVIVAIAVPTADLATPEPGPVLTPVSDIVEQVVEIKRRKDEISEAVEGVHDVTAAASLSLNPLPPGRNDPGTANLFSGNSVEVSPLDAEATTSEAGVVDAAAGGSDLEAAPEPTEGEVPPAPDDSAPEPVGTAPEPEASAPEPVGTAPEPDAGAPEPVGTVPAPDDSASEPDSNDPEPDW